VSEDFNQNSYTDILNIYYADIKAKAIMLLNVSLKNRVPTS